MFAIEIKNLSKSFKKHKVLNNLNLTVKPGEAYGLVGLNGIGKTTTIKILLGLAKQDKGEIYIYGKASNDNKAKSQYLYLPEKFMPSPFLFGSEFLNISMLNHNKTLNKAAAATIAEELDFDSKDLDRQIGKYSKGMGQKLGLIAAFLSGAKLLILDEPMSGLDPRARIALKKKLMKYKKDGNTVFFSSHILADVEEICDTIGIIHDGHLKYQGPVKKFISNNRAKNLEDAYLQTISHE